MKIEITVEKIKALTTKAYKGVSNNRLAPITSLMGLEFSPEGLTIRTFDGENHVVVRDASIKTEEPANITMNADMFKNLIDKLTTKTVSLEIKDKYLEVIGNGTYKMEIVYDDNQVLVMKNIDKDLAKEGTVKNTIDRRILQAALDYNEVSAAKTVEVLFETGAYMGDEIITTDEVLATVTHQSLVKGSKFLFKYSTLHLISVFEKDELDFLVNGKDFLITDGINSVRGTFLDGVEEYPSNEVLAWVTGNPDAKFVTVNTKDVVEALDRLSIFVTPYDNDRVDFEFRGKTLSIKSNQSKAVEVINVEAAQEANDVLALSLTPLKLQLATIKKEKINLYYSESQSLRIGVDGIDYLIATVDTGE